MAAWMNDVPGTIVASKAALRSRITDLAARMVVLDRWLGLKSR
jgi:hypothetical protein